MAYSPSIKHAAMTALLLLWMAIVEASIYRKTVLTTEPEINDDDVVESSAGWPDPIRCHSESMDLDECMRYVENGRSGLLMLASRRSGGSSERAPHRCCQQLSQMREECRCEAIRQLVSGDQRWKREGVEEREVEGRMRRAENLPRTCGLRSQRCSICAGV